MLGSYADGTYDAIRSSDFTSILQLSQQAPSILGREPNTVLSLLTLSASAPEDSRDWEVIERLFFACLQTGDDKSAQLCLNRLTERFGLLNERIIGLRGLYEEAAADNITSLQECLHKYNTVLSENPANMPVLKRRVALLRSMSRPIDAISSLVHLLEAVPTDAEAWCELADLYQSQGMSSQAIFCLEESLLITPNSWNIHARFGELLYISALSSDIMETSCNLLARSLRSFCRSVELCDNYLRGFYGLSLVTSCLLQKIRYQDDADEGFEGVPSKDLLENLNRMATKKLKDMISLQPSGHYGREHGRSELEAAKQLLSRLSEGGKMNR